MGKVSFSLPDEILHLITRNCGEPSPSLCVKKFILRCIEKKIGEVMGDG